MQLDIILLLRNKYQTGFDEPLLHSMYVDKKLKDVNAVQTLSRLNRTCRGKEDTFVLDFENTVDDIKKAFQPFYEATVLDGETNFNVVYDIRNNLMQFNIFNSDDVSKFIKIMNSQIGKKQDETGLGKVLSSLKYVVERYNDLNQKQRFEFRDLLKKFNRMYSYVTSLIRLNDKDLYEEFLFTSNLIKLIPADPKIKIDIYEKIKLEYASLEEQFTGSIILEKKDVAEVKPSNNSGARERNKKKDTLQSIIDKVNDRFSGNFTDGDRVIIEGIYQMFMTDDDVKKFKKYAKDNNPEIFVKSLFPDKFQAIVTKCYLENNDSFKKLFNDPEFYNKVMEEMAKELYKALRKD